jgi:hypothetical protein
MSSSAITSSSWVLQLVVVPKSAHVTTASNFRPISCCNVVYKIISKILVDRLGHALDGIISPMQNAFLGGRRMAIILISCRSSSGNMKGKEPPLDAL